MSFTKSLHILTWSCNVIYCLFFLNVWMFILDFLFCISEFLKIFFVLQCITTEYISKNKCGKVKHELRVQIHELRYEFKSTSYGFKSTSYKFKFTSYELKSTSYEFKSTSQKIKNTIWEIKNTSWSNKTTSWIVNIRVKRKNSWFKIIEFHDFTVSNETILRTKQEFFFTKVPPYNA